MKVFGVVGWKNNGKTTLVERLISQLTSMGYKVSSVKHAHHNVDIDEPGRDSYRHRAAGAKQTLLATQHRWALMREHREQDPPNLEQLLPLFEPCDIVIVEGYKGAAHPKLEIIRHLNKEGLLADQMPNIVALVTDQPHLPSDLPQLDLNNIQQITDFVLQHTGLVTTPAVHEVNDCYSPAQQLQTAETVWQGMQALASTQVKSQTLALDQCMNRRLAEALTTPYDSPRFDNAAVDGYAFNCNDLIQQPDATLPLMATEANAGGSEKLSLKQGYCMRVLTGAQMPKGANTVVMQEDVHLTNDSVTFPSHYKAHSNWRPQGEDVKAGEVIINQGQLIRPQDIGLAAAVGQAQLRVYNKVRVALFSTGNEVYELGQELPEDGIYDVNRYLLKALLTSLHCEVTDLGILADDFSTIRTALDSASQDHQLIITSGGASTGSHDHIANVLKDLGEVHAWRLAIKPGRPLAFGQLGPALFLGLPGNPVAANVCTLMFGQPLIRALSGGGWHRPKSYPQKLGFDVNKKVGRREWLRVFQEQQPNGDYVLQRSASHGSGILTSMTRADGLVEVDEASGNIPAGSLVDFIPFTSFGMGDA
ncbi:bifunctional molybdopterin-guanine dinucleotide biosynthesis adaptor protein MobB/molybdopterin molybdotransferase MoeA [Oceanospirillaceae bacterium]|jgi:molybdopterin molybdotransferase|nr:bifunctional molybdopterin-guanine dinucleotide biosynthesis adaptor protein MobB/molybdopterin molybdotransferase MoeA [Oceanospirillaceae bacterium]MBT6100641.1 bifunctional molybdopterin-guanine dinucleotide biosynthesis adaptor protein MobB/molybdopterin molybdotransferase MoeA [Oceanospirillaceae bacterium]MBT7674786.1 bifunctional molybdopterin-guanine dinucleotide biosynthesis adaptor protein MobB/molybdopterin molybdotransferase MoeA [Oceanospirillaceae bacterium]MDB0065097.1 bifuncti